MVKVQRIFDGEVFLSILFHIVINCIESSISGKGRILLSFEVLLWSE